jgi:hypothetical protein
MHSTCLCIMCVDRIAVCVLCLCGNIDTSLACLANAFCVHDEYTTLNAYSLHLHIYDGCGVCARLTWFFLEVSTHTH